MWNFLKSNSSESSLRVNMFIITVPIGMILFSVFFYIMHRTIVPTEIHVTKEYSKYIYEVIPWVSLGAFVGAILAALMTIWYGKKMNKEIENELPKEENTSQLNTKQ